MRNNYLHKFIQFISNIGASPSDSVDTRLQKTLLLFSSLMMASMAVVWGFIYIAFGETLAGAIPLSYSLLSFLSIISFARTRGYQFFRSSQLLLPLLLPFFLMIALGGFVNSSGVILWSLSSPMGAMVFTERRQAIRWFLAFLALVILGAILEPFVQTTSHLPVLMRTIFFVMNIGCTSTVAFVLVQYFVNQKEITLDLLHVEQAKSENLLLNILPESIARRLKEGEESIADNYESASILFVDICSFTPMSAASTPKEIVLFLSELFSSIDQLVEKHHAEKIETIGDSYMVAVGLPVLCEDHAQVIASLALDIQAYLERGVILHGQMINCRIGINSGPLMAGVIGRKKISYHVWGDTVNVASRMESHGIPGQIQISETTYKLIKESFYCEPRELINVKGKGMMQTYLLKHRL